MAKVASLGCSRSIGSWKLLGERLLDSRERNPAGVVRAMGVEGENVTVGEWGAEGETGIGERRRWETGV
jgi:hypothetical protein